MLYAPAAFNNGYHGYGDDFGGLASVDSSCYNSQDDKWVVIKPSQYMTSTCTMYDLETWYATFLIRSENCW